MALKNSVGFMTNQEKELLKWPESLPPPVQVTRLPKEIPLHHIDLIHDQDINNVLHALYFFSEDKYFFYYEYSNSKVPEGFSLEKLKLNGIDTKKYENFYYRRPWDDEKPEKYNYQQFTPANIEYTWQQDIVNKGPMYGRVQLELFEWKRKSIDVDQISEATKDTNPLILQPNMAGIGVDLYKLVRWVKNRFSK